MRIFIWNTIFAYEWSTLISLYLKQYKYLKMQFKIFLPMHCKASDFFWNPVFSLSKSHCAWSICFVFTIFSKKEVTEDLDNVCKFHGIIKIITVTKTRKTDRWTEIQTHRVKTNRMHEQQQLRCSTMLEIFNYVGKC